MAEEVLLLTIRLVFTYGCELVEWSFGILDIQNMNLSDFFFFGYHKRKNKSKTG